MRAGGLTTLDLRRLKGLLPTPSFTPEWRGEDGMEASGHRYSLNLSCQSKCRHLSTTQACHTHPPEGQHPRTADEWIPRLQPQAHQRQQPQPRPHAPRPRSESQPADEARVGGGITTARPAETPESDHGRKTEALQRKYHMGVSAAATLHAYGKTVPLTGPSEAFTPA
jgi:hypothetical protein